MTQSQNQNKLGEMPIGKLLLNMSAPMMVSMFIQALYNTVDSIFVSRLAEDALTAVGLAFPLQNIMGALAIGTGVGINALVSRNLGAGRAKDAEKAANVMIFLNLAYTVVAVVLGLTFSRTYYTMQTPVAPIVSYGEQYISIVLIFSMGMFFSHGFERLLIAYGFASLSMIAQALGAIMNLILDPIFIFSLGLGVRGAAIATVLGQWGAAICALVMLLKYNKSLHLDLRRILPTWPILKGIFAVGLPSTLTVGLNSLVSYAMNAIFLSFSTTAAAVYGVWMKLQSFGFMPVFGMNNGTVAIYSYNYGAGRIDRVQATRKLALKVGVAITLAVAVIYEVLPVPLLRLFDASDYMMSIGVTAMRTCAVGMVFGAVCVICSSACQSLGHARYALGINVCRQMVLQLAAAWLLSRLGRLELVWFAPVIAEVITMCLALYLTGVVMRRVTAAASARE